MREIYDPKLKANLSPGERRGIYAARRYLGLSTEETLGIQIPFDVYFQDPMVAAARPELAFDEDFRVLWEPGLSDGPTSARFVVVDYNGDTGTLVPQARWKATENTFVDQEGKPLDRYNKDPLQFHQVNVWAILQRALAFFEDAPGLGRTIPWGFEGNRLMVVPHAGYGKNAFYDRQSKSLQFYYFDGADDQRVYTCLSTDIINHEFGHAVLDGVRPHFIEGFSVETSAFHEFVGDLTAILIIFRDNAFREYLHEIVGGDLERPSHLTRLAEQFGKEITGKPYLRSAVNTKTMDKVAGTLIPHRMSEVLTGAMFKILIEISKQYMKKRDKTAPQAFAYTVLRMQRMAIQPLDYLPPVDATFKDYARAVLRTEELANQLDPWGYRKIMLDVFHKRGILNDKDVAELSKPHYLIDQPRFRVFHDIESVASSLADAYRFLDDNRETLGIPFNQDFAVADFYRNAKQGRAGERLARQVVVEYLWREEVVLDGEEFGEYDGQTTTMPCGGTLVFDDRGNVLYWTQKPGTEVGAAGLARRDAFLEDVAQAIRSGRVGARLESAKGMLGSKVAPVESRMVDGTVRFELSPHLSIDDDHLIFSGGREWEISS